MRGEARVRGRGGESGERWQAKCYIFVRATVINTCSLLYDGSWSLARPMGWRGRMHRFLEEKPYSTWLSMAGQRDGGAGALFLAGWFAFKPGTDERNR